MVLVVFLQISPSTGQVSDSQGEVLLEVAAVPQKPRPQLHADDPENEEDEEAEEQHVTQHGQSVQQQVDQDTETCKVQRRTISDPAPARPKGALQDVTQKVNNMEESGLCVCHSKVKTVAVVCA